MSSPPNTVSSRVEDGERGTDGAAVVLVAARTGLSWGSLILHTSVLLRSVGRSRALEKNSHQLIRTHVDVERQPLDWVTQLMHRKDLLKAKRRAQPPVK